MKKKFYTLRQLYSFVKNKFNKKIFDWAETGSEDNFTRNKNLANSFNYKLSSLSLFFVSKLKTKNNNKFKYFTINN